MATLYVTEQGARLVKAYPRILVTLDGEVIQAVLLRAISEVVLVGNCGATTPALLALLDAGVGLTFITQSGKLRGQLRSAQSSNLELRLKQYRRQQEEGFCLQVAKNITLGKIQNYRTMARRLLRSIRSAQIKTKYRPQKQSQETSKIATLESSISRFNDFLAQLQEAEKMDVIRGIEGTASKLYFSYLRSGLRWKGEQTFTKRERRPPKDPINAMLSLGYTLLGLCFESAIAVAGLDPQAGFFHTNRYGRPSLALDLIEEFRPIIVDSMVWRMVNHHMLTSSHFMIAEGGKTMLNRRGLKTFFRQFHRRINTKVFHPLAGRALSYQKCFEVQTNLLRKVIVGEEAEYLPMPWK